MTIRGGVVPYGCSKTQRPRILQARFAAEEVGGRAAMEDGRLMNARVDITRSIMLMDPMPEHGYPASTHKGFNLHLHVDDADAWFDRAVGAGCEIVMPMALQFWGDRYGMVRDPFGVTWAFGTTPA